MTKMFEYEKTNMSAFIGGINNCDPSINVTAETVAEAIRDNARLREIVARIREYKKLGDETGRDTEKRTLPYVTTSGIFTYRNDKSLVHDSYTYIGVLDLDVNEKTQLNTNVSMPDIKQQLTEDESIILVADSPSGYIKAWVALKTGEHQPQDHYKLMKQVILPYYNELYDCIFDVGQVRLSQPFFLTSDADAYIEFDVTPVDLDYTIKRYRTVPQGMNSKGMYGKASAGKLPAEWLKNKLQEINNLKQGEIWTKLGGISFNIGIQTRKAMLPHDPNDVLDSLLNFVANAANIKNKPLQEKNARNSFYNGFTGNYQ